MSWRSDGSVTGGALRAAHTQQAPFCPSEMRIDRPALGVRGGSRGRGRPERTGVPLAIHIYVISIAFRMPIATPPAAPFLNHTDPCCDAAGRLYDTTECRNKTQSILAGGFEICAGTTPRSLWTITAGSQYCQMTTEGTCITDGVGNCPSRRWPHTRKRHEGSASLTPDCPPCGCHRWQQRALYNPGERRSLCNGAVLQRRGASCPALLFRQAPTHHQHTSGSA